MADTSDRTWVESRLARWRETRDNEALGELLKWQRDRAYATALRLVRGPSDAEDVVQKAFLKLLSRTKGFEDIDAFRAAVYRSVVQCALDSARAETARTRRENAMRLTRQPAHHSPEGAVANAENVRALDEAMSGLEPDDRALVVLCCQEGLTASAASRAVGRPRETLRRRLSKCLSSLRERLGKRGVVLSVAGVVTLLQSGKATAATATLCATLDATLPGAGCATVAAAAAAPASVASILATVGVAAKIKLATTIATAVAAVAGTVGVGVVVAVANGPEPLQRPVPAVYEMPTPVATQPAPSPPPAPAHSRPAPAPAPAVAAARTASHEPILPVVELEDEDPQTAPKEGPEPAAEPPLEMIDDGPREGEPGAEPAPEEDPEARPEPDGIYAIYGRARTMVYWVMVRSDGTIIRTRDARDMSPPHDRAGLQPRRPPHPPVRDGDREERPARDVPDRDRSLAPPGDEIPLSQVPPRALSMAKRAVGGFIPERAILVSGPLERERDSRNRGRGNRPYQPEGVERRRTPPRRLPPGSRPTPPHP